VKEIGTKFDGKQDYIIYIKAKLGENETVPKILEALRISSRSLRTSSSRLLTSSSTVLN
jgi:hypothetical protein